MPNNVDTRVVEMEFDNVQFERGARQTMKTLDALKTSLEFRNTAKGLDSLQNSINNLSFDQILTGVERTASSFDTLFGTLKRKAYETFAEDIVNSVKTGINKIYSMSLGQIKTGGAARAMNLARSQFKIEGLGIEWEKISGSIDEAVSGTAYGMDAAANVASQFAASGVELGEKMTKALKAVSGTAAMTGSSFEDIGQIFNTVSGQGRLMADQLNQLSVRGINAAATLAKSLGKTEAEIRQMTSKGQISFEMFYEAMYDAYAEHAFAANDTYEGALSNVKAALSRMGEIFYTPFYNNAIKPLNKLREIISGFVKALKGAEGDTHSFAYQISRIEGHLGGIANILLNQLAKVMTKFQNDTLPKISSKLETITDRVHDLRVLLRGAFKGTSWLDALNSKDLKKNVKAITAAEIQAAKDIWMLGKYGNGQDRIDALEAAGLRAEVVQKYIDGFITTGYNWEKVSKKTTKSSNTFSKAFKAMAKIFGSVQLVVRDIVSAFKVLKAAVFEDIIPVGVDALSAFSEAFSHVIKYYAKKGLGFTKVADEIRDLTTAFKDIYEELDANAQIYELTVQVLKAVFKAFNFTRTIITAIIRMLAKNTGVLYYFIDIINSLGIIVKTVVGQIIDAFLDVFEIDSDDWLTTITKNIATFVRSVAELISKTTIVQKVFSLVFTVVKAVGVVLKSIAVALSNVFGNFSNGDNILYSFIDGLISVLEGFMSFVSESGIIEKAMSGVVDAFKAFGDFIKGLTGNSVLKNVLSFFEGLTKSVKNHSLVDGFITIIETVTTGIDKVWAAITGTTIKDGGDLGPLTTKFHDLQNGISDGSITAESFGETLAKSISDAKKSLDDDMDNITLFFESLSETIKKTKDDVEDIAKYLGGGLATAIVWVGSWIMTESDLAGLEETDNVLGQIWRWLENVAELEEKRGPKTLGVGNLIDKVTELYDGLKELLPTIKDVVEITMIFNTGIGIKRFGEGIKAFAGGIAGFGSGFKLLAKNVGKAGKIWAKAQKTIANATFLTSFAALLLVILASIVVITSILENSEDGGKSFYIALGVVGGIIALVAVLVGVLLHNLNVALKENDKFADVLGAMAKVIVVMALGVLMLAGSFALIAWTINNVGLGESIAAFVMLALIMGAVFGVLAYVMDLVRGYSFLKASTEKTVTVLNGFAKLLTAFASSILIIAVAFGLLTYIISKNMDSPAVLATSISLLAGLMALIAVLITMATSSTSTRSVPALKAMSDLFKALGTAMILIAVALGLMMGAVKEANGSYEILGIAVGLLGTYMLIMSAIAALASKIGTKKAINFEALGAMFKSFALLMVAFSISIAIIAETLRRAEENNVSIKSLMGMLGIITAIIAICAAVAMIGGGGAAGAMIGVAAAIALLAGSFTLFAIGLQKMAEVDSSGLDKVLKAIGKNFWNIVSMGASLTVAALGVSLFAGALLILSGALWTLVPLVAIFTPLIEMFMNSMDKASTSVEKSTTKLTGAVNGGSGSLGGSIGEKIGAGLRDLIKALKKYAPEIINDIKQIMVWLVEAFFAPLQGIGKGLIDTLVVSLKYIDEHINDILTPLGNIITKILNWLRVYAPFIAITVATIIFQIFIQSFLVIAAYAGDLAHAMYLAIAAVLEALAAELNGEQNDRIATAIVDIISGLMDLIGSVFEALSKTKMADIISGFFDSVIEKFKGAWNKIADIVETATGVKLTTFAIEAMDDDNLPDWVYNKDGAVDSEKLVKYLKSQQIQNEQQRYDNISNTDFESMTYHPNAEIDEEELEKNKEEARKQGEETGTTYGEGVKSGIDTSGAFDALKGMFNASDMLPDASSFSEGFTNMFSGMPDMNSIVGNSGLDTSVLCTPVIDGDNPMIQMNGQLTDLEGGFGDYSLGNLNMGSVSADMATETNDTFNASYNDETQKMYSDLKQAVDDLTAMLTDVTIISDEATIKTSLDVDGKSLATAVMPFVDAKSVANAAKAKAKTAIPVGKR